MSEFLDRPSTCPVCPGVRHPIEKFRRLDLTYCPKCGVPCFFPSLTLAKLTRVYCVFCQFGFDPREGGGVKVVFRMGVHGQVSTETPRGYFENLSLVMPDELPHVTRREIYPSQREARVHARP